MTRLFVAVLPDEAVTAAVDGALDALREGPDDDRWRPVAAERRHVTLRFHADADPRPTADALRDGLAGLRAPTLRCAGAGVFGTALWLGVRPADPEHWSALLDAVGADPDDHVAHLTVARARRPGRRPTVPAGLDAHRGPAWTPATVALVASGVPYRVVEAFPLLTGAPGGPAGGSVGPAR